ncbi:MAG: hypothetical protein Q9208_002662 [Pyrenodesmia sp. 3 TL-2023]
MQLRYTIIVIAIQLLQLLNASAVPRPLSSRHVPLSSSLSTPEHNSSITARGHDIEPAPALISRDLRLARNIFQRVQDYAPGWQAHFNLLDVVLPNYQMAATQLEEFYVDILGAVGDVWASEPARHIRECSLGEISLSLRSNQPIPWDWIQGFATDMIRGRGDALIASYKVTFVSVAGAIVVAHLRIANPGAAAAA